MIDYNKSMIKEAIKSADDEELLLTDNNNCTVRAFAIAEGISLKQARDFLAPFRKEGRGINTKVYKDFLINRGYKYSFHGVKTSTIEKAGILSKDKTYICIKSKHAFTLKEGVFSEKIHGRTIIYYTFEKPKTWPLMVINNWYILPSGLVF